MTNRWNFNVFVCAATSILSVLKHEVGVSGHGGHINTSYLGGSADEHRLLEFLFLRMRNARQSAPASRSASVFMHEVDVCGHGGHAHRRYLGGPESEYRLSEVSFCDYAMRGSPRIHPALLVSSCTKLTYVVMLDISTARISEGPEVHIAYSRSHFANAQCEAVRGRIPLC